MNITILYNKPEVAQLSHDRSASEEDTETEAKLAGKILKKRGHKVSYVPITYFTTHHIAKIKADCIINFVEYTGLELQYIGNVFLELRKLGIPFTGCQLDAYIVTANKITMKTAFDSHRIQSPRWQLFETGEEPVHTSFSYPLIAKLALEHCGVGLTEKAIVHSEKDLFTQVRHLLKTYKQPVIAEEYIDGRELQVTLLSQKDKVEVLPIAEYIFPENQKTKILTYDSRWHSETTNNITYFAAQAKLLPKVQKSITSMCVKAYRDLGFSGYGRFDLRLKGDTPYIIETNTNPGLDEDPENGLVLSYRAAGMSYTDFLEGIVHQAIKYPGK